MSRKPKYTAFIYVNERDKNGNITKKNTILFSDDELYEMEDENSKVAAYVITNDRRFYIDDDDYSEYLRIQ